jgi:hypothetical protein
VLTVSRISVHRSTFLSSTRSADRSPNCAFRAAERDLLLPFQPVLLAYFILITRWERGRCSAGVRRFGAIPHGVMYGVAQLLSAFVDCVVVVLPQDSPSVCLRGRPEMRSSPFSWIRGLHLNVEVMIDTCCRSGNIVRCTGGTKSLTAAISRSSVSHYLFKGPWCINPVSGQPRIPARVFSVEIFRHQDGEDSAQSFCRVRLDQLWWLREIGPSTFTALFAEIRCMGVTFRCCRTGTGTA